MSETEIEITSVHDTSLNDQHMKDADADTNANTGIDDNTNNNGYENTQFDESEEPTQAEINYKTWKKNAPMLYQYIQTSSQVWPSLTIQWFPDVDNHSPDSTNQRLLLGTYSSGFNKFESLSIYQLKLPHAITTNTISETLSMDTDFNPEKNEFVYSQHTDKFKNGFNLMQRIPHKGDINKAKYMPQNPNLIATATNLGDLLVFDRTKKPNNFDESTISTTTKQYEDIRLKFHTADTWGLDWNGQLEGELVSGSNDGLLALWDITKIEKITAQGRQLKPILERPLHDYSINCVEYNPSNSHLVGSVGDDKMFKMTDLRQPSSSSKQETLSYKHDSKLNVVNFNSFNPFGLAMGDEAGQLSLFDLRSLQKPIIQVNKAHEDSITQLKWNPELKSTLLSCSLDGSVKLWDFAKSGNETANGDDQIQNQLIFKHGGHLHGVNDADWNPNDCHMVASCSDDNTVQIWKPTKSVFM
ncbi:unnamed protein product [Ambrosiozyma monospora]|uniref:Unnamed protein product n=1 Tax=Ambrosiozyma monospora TaxID=43982 RepID=A0A9W6YKM5_AMBMO|nr:unnamed protein product [Ambrosiozyma monospora]